MSRREAAWIKEHLRADEEELLGAGRRSRRRRTTSNVAKEEEVQAAPRSASMSQVEEDSQAKTSSGAGQRKTRSSPSKIQIDGELESPRSSAKVSETKGDTAAPTPRYERPSTRSRAPTVSPTKKRKAEEDLPTAPPTKAHKLLSETEPRTEDQAEPEEQEEAAARDKLRNITGLFDVIDKATSPVEPTGFRLSTYTIAERLIQRSLHDPALKTALDHIRTKVASESDKQLFQKAWEDVTGRTALLRKASEAQTTSQTLQTSNRDTTTATHSPAPVPTPRHHIAHDALSIIRDRQMLPTACIENILSVRARSDQKVKATLTLVRDKIASAAACRRFDEYVAQALQQLNGLRPQPSVPARLPVEDRASGPNTAPVAQPGPLEARNAGLSAEMATLSKRMVAQKSVSMSDFEDLWNDEALLDGLVSRMNKSAEHEAAIRATSTMQASAGQKALFSSTVQNILALAEASRRRGATHDGPGTSNNYKDTGRSLVSFAEAILSYSPGKVNSHDLCIHALYLRSLCLPSFRECVRRAASSNAGEGEIARIGHVLDEARVDIQANKNAYDQWQKLPQSSSARNSAWNADLARQALSRGGPLHEALVYTSAVELLGCRMFCEQAFYHCVASAAEGREDASSSYQWNLAIAYARALLTEGKLDIKPAGSLASSTASEPYGPSLSIVSHRYHADSSLSRRVLAQRTVLQLQASQLPTSQRHTPLSDPVISALADRAASSSDIESAVRAVSAGKPTTQQLRVFDIWVDLVTRWCNEERTQVDGTTQSAVKQSGNRAVDRSQDKHHQSISRESERFTASTGDEELVDAPPSMSSLAAKVVKSANDEKLGVDAQDPVVRRLLDLAKRYAALPQLLNNLAIGRVDRRSLQYFIRLVEECTESRDVRGSTSRTPAPDPRKTTSTTLAPKTSDTRQDINADEVKELQVVAMRARIAIEAPALPSSDPLVRNIATRGQSDATFRNVIDHLAGANGNVQPNQVELLAFKKAVDDCRREFDAVKEVGNEPANTRLQGKLAADQWPLQYSYPYKRMLEADRWSGRRQSADAWTRRTKPLVKYCDHPYCVGGQHTYRGPNDAQYPLIMLPRQTWDAVHNNKPDGAVCALCQRPRTLSAHERKMFLVGERLSWTAGSFGVKAKSKNEAALWEVNFKLGIEEPVLVSSQGTTFGFKPSGNKYHPFTNEAETKFAMDVVASAEGLTESSWALRKRLVDEELRASATNTTEIVDDEIMITGSRPAMSSISTNARPFPPKHQPITCERPEIAKATVTSMSLRDFYVALDKIERMSPMGARFLEAYAEKLRMEVCKSCWFERIAGTEQEIDD